MRAISSLKLELACEPPRSMQLVVHPYQPFRNSRPVEHGKGWLDVMAGDHIFIAGKRHRVTAVSVYRAADGGRTVGHEPMAVNGRAWIASDSR